MTEVPRSTVCLTFDFDAISLWIGPFAARSPSMISRGEFGAVGCERILRLLDREGIPATFFVTGHTADTYPDHVRAIAAAGHEIGHHGYLHENPLALETPEREREVLLKGFDALDRAAGVRPTGYRSPSWDNSPYTIDLLLEQGFRYESSLMGNDFTPYWCRTGDVIQPDGPYLFGPEVDLVEMPVSWILDDFPALRIRLDPVARHQPNRALRPLQGRRDLAGRVHLHAARRAGRRLHPDHAPPGHRPRPPHADAGAADRSGSKSTRHDILAARGRGEAFRAAHPRQ